jgi:hypothetical protein
MKSLNDVGDRQKERAWETRRGFYSISNSISNSTGNEPKYKLESKIIGPVH